MSRKSNFKLYRVWDGIVQRCYNPKAKNYHNYGGRGIAMFGEWRNNFSAFEKFCLARGWRHGLQVDRIDNSVGYFPENIRFVSSAENLRNKRTNHLITYNGETRCLTDWSNILGIPDSTLQRRLNSGWSVEDAFTRPIQRHRKMERVIDMQNKINEILWGYGLSLSQVPKITDYLLSKIDLVEVVRCKDCAFWDNGRCEGIQNGLTIEYTKPTDFCSYGKRKGGAGE